MRGKQFAAAAAALAAAWLAALTIESVPLALFVAAAAIWLGCGGAGSRPAIRALAWLAASGAATCIVILLISPTGPSSLVVLLSTMAVLSLVVPTGFGILYRPTKDDGELP